MVVSKVGSPLWSYDREEEGENSLLLWTIVVKHFATCFLESVLFHGLQQYNYYIT